MSRQRFFSSSTQEFIFLRLRLDRQLVSDPVLYFFLFYNFRKETVSCDAKNVCLGWWCPLICLFRKQFPLKNRFLLFLSWTWPAGKRLCDGYGDWVILIRGLTMQRGNLMIGRYSNERSVASVCLEEGKIGIFKGFSRIYYNEQLKIQFHSWLELTESGY